MASPVVQTTAEGASTTASTSHTVAFPSGSTTGDLIVIAFGQTGSNGVTSPNAEGFTALFPIGGDAISVWYKQLDGSEGTDTVVVIGASTRTAWTVYRITGHADPATQAPEATFFTGTASLNPDPPSITPTGGTKDYLFITGFRQDGEEIDDDTWCNSAPTNYGTLLQKTCGTAGAASSNVSIATAHRAATVSSEDPGTFNVDQSLAYRAFTLAVHPPTAAFAPPPGLFYDHYRQTTLIRR